MELKELIARTGGPGRVEWIGIRPARREALLPCEEVEIGAGGLAGDHGRPGKRAVTMIQAEHLDVIAALIGRDVLPQMLRRNIVVSGINLTALKGRSVRMGSALLRWTTVCAPCSRMEEALGNGGYAALRGHGGWCAEVIEPGTVRVNDRVSALPVG
ncbi:MOSC domain-containing protein [Pontivivens nitratireducens]|uniref:MOSC domain-containing protein n=1 Tax=Pontivivens nitratireducens TaxID=2758038 RepID=UPI00163992CC|nr:MOSC domain-containing protein [Pontibrevibacter nitratireducens]